jgi:hypothetical protein
MPQALDRIEDAMRYAENGLGRMGQSALDLTAQRIALGGEVKRRR